MGIGTALDIIPDEVEEDVEDEGFGELGADELPGLVSGFDVKVGKRMRCEGIGLPFCLRGYRRDVLHAPVPAYASHTSH